MSIKAPWPNKLVNTLNKFQASVMFHPYTCGNRGDGNHLDTDVLVATTEGWTCPICDYTQNWCHEVDYESLMESQKLMFGDHK